LNRPERFEKAVKILYAGFYRTCGRVVPPSIKNGLPYGENGRLHLAGNGNSNGSGEMR